MSTELSNVRTVVKTRLEWKPMAKGGWFTNFLNMPTAYITPVSMSGGDILFRANWGQTTIKGPYRNNFANAQSAKNALEDFILAALKAATQKFAVGGFDWTEPESIP